MSSDDRPVWRGPPQWRGWEGRRGPRPLLAVLIGAIQVIGTSLGASDQASGRGLDTFAYVLLLAGPAALLLRRRRPLGVYGITLVATIAYLLAGYPTGPFFLAAVVALFGAVRRGERPAVWGMTAAGYVAFVLLGEAAGRLVIAGRGLADPDLGTYIAVAAWTVAALVLAEMNRIRSKAFTEMARAQAEAARARQEQSRRQASDERLRIARELHDVLGHHLSLINVRAGVALHLLDTDREQAREALDAIKVASAEALREVRGVLSALNPSDESAPRTPAPGLDEIDQLAADARAAGLKVAVHRGGDGAVPGEVGRAAYRIVQEALTNVRRHAGPAASVTLRLGYARDTLTLLVEDTGTGPGPSTSDGNGIPGMRERAHALGGTLETGPRPDGGFRVAARLPLAGPVTEERERA